MVTRADVLAEAETFIGVKWRHQGRTKEHGVDCVGFPDMVAFNLGLVDELQPANYPRRPDGTFLPLVRATPLIEIRVRDARPADVLVFSASCEQFHMGIMATLYSEPAVIHAWAAARRVSIERLATAQFYVGLVTHAFKYPNLED